MTNIAMNEKHQTSQSCDLCAPLASIIAVCYVADVVSHACALTLLACRAHTTVLADL